MSRLKPLIPILLWGLIYPATLYGWSREALLETAWGPVHVLWAFALGLGIMVYLGAGCPRRRLPLILGVGYLVSGTVWWAGPPRALDLEARLGIGIAIVLGTALLGAVWGHALAANAQVSPVKS